MLAALEEHVIKKVVGLSDDNLMFLSGRIDKFVKPVQAETTSKKSESQKVNLLYQMILMIAMMKLQKCLG